ncbi:MAG: hypothetical protein HC838_02310 [Spirulinaceae cyanobacterium RM2_2_10]|nr:hypothetical protein [Spirulinaceae cyanobacterium SM2_1_0]NJO19129.1 hypothetical protein [Spirulinaceae cyanobacterium RM2_2_10]
MARLSDRAFKILAAEVKRCAAAEGIGGDVQARIVMKRLEKLRRQGDTPAGKPELHQAVSDVFPDFSDKVLDNAVRANRGPGLFSYVGWGFLGLASLVAGIWVLNLPYPPIRRPVARTAPILLLPSFISMDHNYRQAIAKVEQADQLVNRATSDADFELGATKVSEAQAHLDALPIWFLGYEPQVYCRFFGCTWRFTLDEFEAARATIGRMEAQLFQEQNALTQLQTAEAAVATAKQQYQQAAEPSAQQLAVANWRTALDQVSLIPEQTLAGRTAQQKLVGYQRDFETLVGLVANSEQANTLITAAQQFAWQAAQASQNPPHSAAEWEKIETLWEQAIAGLARVSPENDPAGYVKAQELTAQYTRNLGDIRTREEAERTAEQALAKAQNQIQQLLASIPDESSPADIARSTAQIQGIINELEKIQPGTTAHPKATELLGFAQAKLQELQ